MFPLFKHDGLPPQTTPRRSHTISTYQFNFIAQIRPRPIVHIPSNDYKNSFCNEISCNTTRKVPAYMTDELTYEGNIFDTLDAYHFTEDLVLRYQPS